MVIKAQATANLVRVINEISRQFATEGNEHVPSEGPFKKLWDHAKHAVPSEAMDRIKDHGLGLGLLQGNCHDWVLLPLYDALLNALKASEDLGDGDKSHVFVTGDLDASHLKLLFANHCKPEIAQILKPMKCLPLLKAADAIHEAKRRTGIASHTHGLGLKNIGKIVDRLGGDGLVISPDTLRPRMETELVIAYKKLLGNLAPDAQDLLMPAFKLFLRLPLAKQHRS